MRTVSSLASALRFQDSTEFTRSRAHSAALVALRKLVDGGPKKAISPSPKNLSIDPWLENTASLKRRRSSRSTRMTVSGDLLDENSVKPTMSTNRTAAE